MVETHEHIVNTFMNTQSRLSGRRCGRPSARWGTLTSCRIGKVLHQPTCEIFKMWFCCTQARKLGLERGQSLPTTLELLALQLEPTAQYVRGQF
jgi:hypothetical protein